MRLSLFLDPARKAILQIHQDKWPAHYQKMYKILKVSRLLEVGRLFSENLLQLLKFSLQPADSFHVKKCPCDVIFFKHGEKSRQTYVKAHSPSLRLSVPKLCWIWLREKINTLLHGKLQHTLCVHCFQHWVGGGELLCAYVKTLLPTCRENQLQDFFHIKRIGMPNSSGFWPTSKIATKSVLL